MNYYKSTSKVFAVLFLILFASCNIEPFEGDIPEKIVDTLPSSCEEAAKNTGDAALAYGAASTTDSNYPSLCNAYKKALEDQVAVCGDEGGAFQALIDSIGDCEEEEEEEESEDGDYWPMKINNSWSYIAKITGLPDSESKMEITNLVNYKGEDSYLYENFFGAIQGTDGTGLENLKIDYYTRKSGGEYTILVGELTAEFAGLYRITQSEYDYVVLKDNVDVGSTWDYNFNVVTSYEAIGGSPASPDITTNYDMDFEILEKNASVVSAGVTYNSVIKVKFTQKVSIEGLPTSTSITEYIYSFAKDVGIVKAEGTVFDGDDNITSNVLQELESYSLN